MQQANSPPTRSSSALLVGSDDMLIYTRTQILEKEGFRVSQVEPSRAVERLKSASPDLIVACHTLSTEEADDLVQAARSLPEPPALIGFTKELSPRPTKLPFDDTVWSLASPESFVSKVHELLRPRTSQLTS